MACIHISQNKDLLIVQYQKSPNLKNLIIKLEKVIQTNMLDILCEFQNSISIDNAQLWFLDRIGNNLGYQRPALPSGIFDYWGYDDNGTNYDQAPFYYGNDEELIPASDYIYKKLLKCWIKKLFFDGSILDTNKALNYAFDEGYIVDHENLAVSVVIFDQPYDLIYSIIKTGIIPKVAGIGYKEYIMESNNTNFFGFEGSDSVGFDQESFVRTIYKKDIQ